MPGLSFAVKPLIKFATALVLVLGASGCASPQRRENVSPTRTTSQSSTPETGPVDELRFAYNKDCRRFIAAFPTNFSQFRSLYGYNDSMGPLPLYSHYEQHTEYFFSCAGTELSVNELFERLLSVSDGGRWEADAVGLLQSKISAFVQAHPAVVLLALSKESDSRSAGFWHFLFDGPHPESELKRKEYDKTQYLVQKDKRQTVILREEFEKLVKGGRKDL